MIPEYEQLLEIMKVCIDAIKLLKGEGLPHNSDSETGGLGITA
jgi:hypothetical protein